MGIVMSGQRAPAKSSNIAGSLPISTDNRCVRPTYEEELEALAETFATVTAWDADELRGGLARLASGPAAFVASGGMVAVATLAAQLHECSVLEPASALTPLGLISRPAIHSSGVVLLTSSGKHPDAVEVMRRLGRPGMRPAVVLTHRDASALPVQDSKVITLPPLPLREGFLAVNSVLSMVVALIRGYLGDQMSVALGAAEAEHWGKGVDRLLVLHPPDLAAAAADVEARVSEIGLAAAQAVDYRNFAHGRHTGLNRMLDSTTVVALSDPRSESLAEATLGVLPPRARVVRWHSEAPWPISAVELMVVSMRACGQLGKSQKVSLSRPKVPVFGRRLYRLPIRRKLPDVLLDSVDRKLATTGAGGAGSDLREIYETAFGSWRKDLTLARFGAIVLDYDGTVCTTEGRFFPPERPVAEALNQLLDGGLILGFASGRGPSLHSDLRRVIDRAFWGRVELGLYNGGYLTSLDKDLEDLRKPSPLIAQVDERLRELPMRSELKLEPRRVQLTVEPGRGSWVKPRMLADAVAEVLARKPALPVKVVRSGHSLDVVPLTTSKVAVIERVNDLADGESLAVGDQGHIGGNDFELLAFSRWSLSVDQCSADPTRCWYVGDGSLSGPALLLRYLKALTRRADGHAIRTKAFR